MVYTVISIQIRSCSFLLNYCLMFSIVWTKVVSAFFFSLFVRFMKYDNIFAKIVFELILLDMRVCGSTLSCSSRVLQMQ